MLLTQINVLICWVFFRAAKFDDAKHILKSMFSFSAETTRFKPDANPLLLLVVFIIMEAFLIGKFDRKLLYKSPVYRRWEPILVGLLIVVTIFYRGEKYGFIYFQF